MLGGVCLPLWVCLGPRDELLPLWSMRVLGVTCCPQGCAEAGGGQLPPCPRRYLRHLPAPISHLQLALLSVGMLGLFTCPCSPGTGWGYPLALWSTGTFTHHCGPQGCWGCPAALEAHMDAGMTGHPRGP